MHRRTVLTTLLSLPLAAVPREITAQQPERKPVIAGYLPEYRFDAFDGGAAASLTDLLYFSIEPRPGGELERRRLTPEVMARLAEWKVAQKVRVLVTVGGWSRSAGFPAVTRDAGARKQFISNLARLCDEAHLDGIDFDWEHPASREEEDTYAALIQETRREFAPKGWLVTAALAGWQKLPESAFQALDRLHLMAYDHPGRHSTLEQARADLETVKRKGAVAGRICLGVPFYGRGITDAQRAVTYAEIMRKYSPAPATDEVDGLYFNGIETVRAKAKLAAESGLAGTMVWELGQDTRDDTSLLRAMRGMKEPQR